MKGRSVIYYQIDSRWKDKDYSAPGEADMFTLDTKGQKTLVSDVAGTAVQAEYLGR